MLRNNKKYKASFSSDDEDYLSPLPLPLPLPLTSTQAYDSAEDSYDYNHEHEYEHEHEHEHEHEEEEEEEEEEETAVAAPKPKQLNLQRQLEDAKFHIRRLELREVQYKMAVKESDKARIFRRTENADLRNKLKTMTEKRDKLEAVVNNDSFDLCNFELIDLPLCIVETKISQEVTILQNENARLKAEQEKHIKHIDELRTYTQEIKFHTQQILTNQQKAIQYLHAKILSLETSPDSITNKQTISEQSKIINSLRGTIQFLQGLTSTQGQPIMHSYAQQINVFGGSFAQSGAPPAATQRPLLFKPV